MTRRDLRDQSGFTLVELIVGITILGIIMVPLTTLVITYLLNSASIAAQLNESKDQQVSAAYWQQDVASIGKRDGTGGALNSINADSACGSAGTALVTFSWTKFALDGTSSIVRVTYFSANGGQSLVRAACDGAVTQSTLARNVDASVGFTCSVNGSSWVQCSTLGGAGGSKIYLKFRVRDSSGKGSPYDTTLIGQRRQT